MTELGTISFGLFIIVAAVGGATFLDLVLPGGPEADGGDGDECRRDDVLSLPVQGYVVAFTNAGRHFHRQGALLLDTPGMRELQLADCDEGINATFADITALAEKCRFGDCQHDSEPGCAVKNAIENCTLEARRLSNYRKLMREQAFNSASLAEKRARDKNFGKMIKSILADKQQEKGNK